MSTIELYDSSGEYLGNLYSDMDKGMGSISKNGKLFGRYKVAINVYDMDDNLVSTGVECNPGRTCNTEPNTEYFADLIELNISDGVVSCFNKSNQNLEIGTNELGYICTSYLDPIQDKDLDSIRSRRIDESQLNSETEKSGFLLLAASAILKLIR